jgi:purine-binding chemotaxis protein CheW
MRSRQRPVEAADWEKIRSRLARAVATSEGTVRLSPQRAWEVLEERARALARVPAAVAGAAEGIEVVTFALAGEEYAVPTRCVREVVRTADYTPLPGAPPFLLGVLNLRGDILALVDLCALLGLPGGGPADRAHILVLGEDRPEFGVLADAAHEVRTLLPGEVLPLPDSVSAAARPFLRGVTREALILLDGAALLKDSRLFIDEGEGR